MMLKPILYLDVDDTLVSYLHCPELRARVDVGIHGLAPTNVRQFLEEATALCEIRWLTAWCPHGEMIESQIERLSRILDVPSALLSGHRNQLKWWNHKTDGIDWVAHAEGREWFWVEDFCSDGERARLRGNHAEDRYYRANTSEDRDALWKAWCQIKARIEVIPCDR